MVKLLSIALGLVLSAMLLAPQVCCAAKDKKMDAEIFKTLKKDHGAITKLINKVEKADPAKRADWLVRLNMEIVPHMRAEVMVFYKALEQKQDAQQDAMKAIEEHKSAEKLLAELQNMPTNDAAFSAKLTAFKSAVHDHFTFEESTIFTEAEKDFSPEELKSMHSRFMQQKKTEQKAMSAHKT